MITESIIHSPQKNNMAKNEQEIIPFVLFFDEVEIITMLLVVLRIFLTVLWIYIKGRTP